MSKGSSPRPFTVSQEELGNRIESIFGKKVKEQYVPPPLPDMTDEPKKKIDWGNNDASKSNGE